MKLNSKIKIQSDNMTTDQPQFEEPHIEATKIKTPSAQSDTMNRTTE